jgi:hypothetical protein
MKKRTLLAVLCFVAVGMFAGAVRLDEGMWLLDSIGKLPLAEMKRHGLELTPEQIYSPNGPSLKDAIILLGGGTASFVSPEGLVVTNHHVAYAGIQSLSSVQDDYLKNGFLAKKRMDELSTTYTAQLLVSMKDVTADILAVVADTMSADARAKAIREKSTDIEAAAKGTAGYTCRVSEMFSGLKYYLMTYASYGDVRLVYAPPSAIGNFGGEVDNWMWPRHTGDFSLMRVYCAPDGKPAKYSRDNVPYRPKVFLPISTQGYAEGSFAMIMGYPGRTFRYREAAAVQLAHDETLPLTIDLYKIRIDIFEAAAKKDRAAEIKLAGRVRGLANTYKNYQGTLQGMHRSDLIATKRNEEIKFAAFLASSSEMSRKYGTVMADLEKATSELKTFNRKNILLANITAGVDGIRLASRLNTFAGQFRDSSGVVVAPSGKDQDALREFIGNVFKSYDTWVDKQTLARLIEKAADMPVDQQPQFVRDLISGKSEEERVAAVGEFVDDLYKESTILTPSGCERLIAKGAADITDDPFAVFAAKVNAELAPLTQKNTRITARLNQLRQKYIEAWLEWKKSDLHYPDANRTMRFTYGTVKSYDPRDAVGYHYHTTLSGVIDKEQSEGVFAVPPRLHQLWAKKDYGRYADKEDGEVHVAFLADLDITGGNSGSPVINGKGELIGCAFDGNWEAVVGDYYFQPQLNRTIAVDSRYMLFVLDKFSGADTLLKELVIH